jgi:hypothetical protein
MSILLRASVSGTLLTLGQRVVKQMVKHKAGQPDDFLLLSNICAMQAAPPRA